MKKPILLHDIDGVLFGQYDGTFQLRPCVKTWLNWAHEHFQVIWFTTWRPENIRQLLTSLYMAPSRTGHPFLCADWYNWATKEAWLEMAAKKTNFDYYWIDDNIPTVLPDGVEQQRCIRVDPTGEHELKSVQKILESTVLQSVHAKISTKTL
ncbi:MAG: hypothetical protein KF722_12245 [Nitrospira sp.]|nr:hypothetical protein [Nitrospira sp.]